MSKYRGFAETKDGDTTITLKNGIEVKGEWIYTDLVEISAPCGEPYYAGLLVDGYKGIPIYTQVYTETVQKCENGEFLPLTEKEISDIKTYLENHMYFRLD